VALHGRRGVGPRRGAVHVRIESTALDGMCSPLARDDRSEDDAFSAERNAVDDSRLCPRGQRTVRLHSRTPLCTARLTAEGCQPAEGNACVKWGESWSHIFRISCGVRQGSVLSPVFFSVYIDDIGQLYRITSLAPLLYYNMPMTFCYWHRRSQLYRNYYGYVSRKWTQ